MEFNKLRAALRVLTLLFVGTGLLSCVKDVKPAKKEGSATFRIETISGDSVESKTHSTWQLPEEKLFNFKVCLKDVLKQEPVLNHEFIIQEDGVTLKDVITDNLGCLNWSENNFKFNPLERPKYYTLKRTIVSAGVHRGQREISIAVNPWSGFNGEEPAVVDLSKNDVTYLAKSTDKLSLEAASSARLVLESLTYRIDREKEVAGVSGLNASLYIEFSPNLALQTMAGGEKIIALQAGQFQVKPYLIRESNGEKIVLHESLPALSVALSNAVAQYVSPVRFNRAITKEGSYELGLKVVPRIAHIGFPEFDGVFQIGEWTQVLGGRLSLIQSLQTTGKNQFKLTNYLEDVNLSDSGQSLTSSFVLGEVKGEPRGVPQEESLQRIVRVRMSVPVLSSLRPDPLYGRKFKIYTLEKGLSGPSRVVTVDKEDGQLKWEDSVIHQYYGKIERLPFQLIIEDVITSQRIMKTIKINPWDFGTTFFDDVEESTQFADTSPQLLSPVKKEPVLLIDNVCLARTDTLYQIDNELDLTVKHRYNITLDPKVFRFDDLNQGLSKLPENLRVGHYLLTILVYKTSLDQKGENEIVATYQKIVFNQRQFPSTEIELDFDNLDIISLKNYIAVQITLLDNESLNLDQYNRIRSQEQFKLATESALVSPIYTAPFVPANKGCQPIVLNNQLLDENQKNLNLRLQNQAAMVIHKEFQEAASKRAFAFDKASYWLKVADKWQTEPLLIATEEDISSLGITNTSKEKIFDTLICLDQVSWAHQTDVPKCTKDQSVIHAAKQLCNLFNKSNKNECISKPFEFILAQDKTIVSRISAFNYKGGFSTQLSFMSSFAMGAFLGSDFGTMHTDSIAANVAGGVSLGKLATAGAGVSATKSLGSFMLNFSRDFKDNQVRAGNDTSLTLENADFQIKLAEYRKCFVVRSSISNERSYFVCGDLSNEPKVVTERYYYLFSPGTNSVLLDSSSVENRWFFSLRGERDFYVFLTLANESLAPFNRNGQPVEVLKMLKRAYAKASERLPGELSVLSSPAPGFDQFDRKEGSIKDKPIVGFNPFEDFGNKALRDVNHPDRGEVGD